MKWPQPLPPFFPFKENNKKEDAEKWETERELW